MVYGVFMIRTQIMLTPSLKAQISNYAQYLNISFSAAIRELAQKSLAKLAYQKKNSVNNLLKLADSAGKGPKDLASNDHYLY